MTPAEQIAFVRGQAHGLAALIARIDAIGAPPAAVPTPLWHDDDPDGDVIDGTFLRLPDPLPPRAPGVVAMVEGA